MSWTVDDVRADAASARRTRQKNVDHMQVWLSQNAVIGRPAAPLVYAMMT
jgi:hypothetical protein